MAFTRDQYELIKNLLVEKLKNVEDWEIENFKNDFNFICKFADEFCNELVQKNIDEALLRRENAQQEMENTYSLEK